MISIRMLSANITNRLPVLTGDRRHPGIEQRFQSNLFVAGL